MSSQNIDSIHFILLAINKGNGTKRVLPQDGRIFLLRNEELVLEISGAQCPIHLRLEGGHVKHAASRFYELNARLCPCESNFFVSSWESSRKDVSAAVLKVEEGREVFVVAKARDIIVHTLCFTVTRAS